jgi:hypothetical protein
MKNKNQVNLFDINNIDDLPWTNSETAILVKNYWLPLMKNGSSFFINNVNSKLLALTIDDLILPVTVNNQELDNSYVCSPYCHYISYSKEELYTLKNPWLEKFLKFLLDFMGIFLKLGKINQVVIVNNWLLSTNLYPNLSTTQIEAITIYLKNLFPDHAIIFRSINTFVNDNLFNSFRDNNYQMIPSRQIYLCNPQGRSPMKSKMRWRLKQDFNLIEKQGYEIINSEQISPTEVKRLVELYNSLYLEKYSYNNPQFNEKFLELAIKNKTLQIQALRKKEKIDGVIGFYEINGVMTTPILGYDTSLPQQVGLYRMLTAQLIIESKKRGLILHQSSGASSFKILRGLIANIEYSAVFIKHLSFFRQLIWHLLKLLINQIAVPLMKKYKL